MGRMRRGTRLVLEEVSMTGRTIIPPGIATVATIYGLSRYSYGLFVPQFQRAFPGSVALFGMIGGSSYGAYLVATLAVPRFIARFGPKIPLLFGGICAVVGMCLIGLSSNLVMLTVGVLLAGASPGLAYPPLPEIIRPVVNPCLYNRALTFMNSGTGWGVLLTGPIALLAGSQWHYAWLGFSVVALLSTLWNWMVFPNPRDIPPITHQENNPQAWWARRDIRVLFVLAFCVGIATSVYWTYAVDLITQYEHVPSSMGDVFWVVVGVAGVVGAFGGHFSDHYGFRPTFRMTLVGLTLSLVALPCWLSWVGIFLSATVFGGLFIMVTGLFALWSVAAFPDRPSVGYSAVFFLITAGQLVGPTFLGEIANQWGLPVAFYMAAVLSALTLLVPLPHAWFSPLHSMRRKIS